MHNTTNNTKQAHPRITREFWEALFAIHTHYFYRELDDFHFEVAETRVNHILRSLRTLDCLLDIAAEEGWLE